MSRQPDIPELNQLLSLVRQTKTIIMDDKSRRDITVKGLADFVTRTDTAVQNFLKDALFERWPHVQFFGEENEQHHADFSKPVWVLDPIDGTTNLIYGGMHSAVSLGYCEHGEALIGIIYNPFCDEMFYAVKGGGAYLNNQKISVRQTASLSDSLISVGTSPYNKELAPINFRAFQKVFERSLDIRRSGSAALDLAYTACGRIDGYFERNLKPWDFAAGTIIVSEAGGIVTDFSGNAPDFSKNTDIIASCGPIHKELRETIFA